MTEVSTPAYRRRIAAVWRLRGIPRNRHSRAMHLNDAGVPLPYIRDILGHADLSTTDIYARASTKAKRKALEAVYDQVVSADLAECNQDQNCSTGSPTSTNHHRVMRSVRPSSPLAAGDPSGRCA
jgi:hypothetical protein